MSEAHKQKKKKAIHNVINALGHHFRSPEHNAYYDALDALNIAVAIMRPRQRTMLVRIFDKWHIRTKPNPSPDMLEYLDLL